MIKPREKRGGEKRKKKMNITVFSSKSWEQREHWNMYYFAFRAVIPLAEARRLGLLFIAKCDLCGANKIRRIYRLNAECLYNLNWNNSSHHARAAESWWRKRKLYRRRRHNAGNRITWKVSLNAVADLISSWLPISIPFLSSMRVAAHSNRQNILEDNF